MARHRHRVKVATLSERMELSAAEFKHLAVMRLNVGDRVDVFDGSGEAGEAELIHLDTFSAALRLLSRQDSAAEYPQPVTLAIALLKGDKLSDVVRAGTELGVSTFQLLRTRYADVPDIGDSKLTRLRRVAEEAAKQSQRAVVPGVLAPLPLSALSAAGQCFYAHPGSPGKLLEQVTWTSALTLISGPEGGFAPEDLAQLSRLGATPITLGPRILRAETAPLALLGALAASGV
ncbi:16S rRNA (uracil(1498)-N(3))-methyltransferase [Deinococcus psychrotolerans]|uniref:Ribosomal RNA small subunit methyltransferase E n=1 Tax=Deinococcus psychrotolerans TaxID=2489213 RepID=A0A3G8Y8W0_9DEIO|nr:16S rRNA (uracil(1498)-N(3))-methyltransferase [Deinococcus psychrotolerans]AZI41343.1 16S rRNA (uracil(1498)-N(3))-methyltransferase [Deinococcus psychrotolerans]